MAATNSLPHVLQAERRAWSYWFVDGLPNLLTGALCLLLASCFLLLAFHPHTRSPFIIAFVALAIGVYIFVFAQMREILEWLKTRITYPRTGYTTPPFFTYDNNMGHQSGLNMLSLSKTGEKENVERVSQDLDLKRRTWFFVAVFAAETVSTLLIHNPWVCAVAGVAVGVGIWLVTRNDERMSWVAVLGLPFVGMYTFTFNIHPSSASQIKRAGFFLAGTGLLLAVNGGLELIRYLRRNPVAGA